MMVTGSGSQSVGKSCCAPSRKNATLTAGQPPLAGAAGRFAERPPQVRIPAGTFLMGDAFDEGYSSDGERPVHAVHIDAFSIDSTAVTNTMFAEFVADTGYRTDAEIFGSSAVFHLLKRAPRSSILGFASGAPWWLNIQGADWAHPAGPASHWKHVADHPVVHTSHNDSLAYCRWAGRRLPTEAEWEYAARGGLVGQRYAWGNDLHGPSGEHLCNIWQGTFPIENTTEDGFTGTSPVKSFPANGYGLYDVAGNVWEWCADWFLPGYYQSSAATNPQGPTIGAGRVMRGGSYLCHDSYCNRYRVSSRSSNTPDSSSGNCGFRTVALPLEPPA
ncbi:formylglycine-generating enzyme family protein [Arthrobacter sp. S39]|uniref:formylglycine-generating enzyme family protein n=1 Tax=Arthrobacter sp. S39 TaxID=2509720 RepID=UPI001F5FABD2|nr:formylglycine-generating enzyme family protein [Arthrobacter sp. S39]